MSPKRTPQECAEQLFTTMAAIQSMPDDQIEAMLAQSFVLAFAARDAEWKDLLAACRTPTQTDGTDKP